MADLLAAYDDLLARLDWELDENEERIARSALEDLSDDARHYGSSSWVSEAVAPRAVRTMVLRAAVRYMRNPDGYVQSRAGDEVVGWAPRKTDVGAASLSEAEKNELRDLAKRNAGLQTMATYVYEGPNAAAKRDSHVPVFYGGKWFPFV